MKKVPSGVWQLAALMLVHFTADMVGCIIPGILPVLRDNFGMTLQMGVIFLAIRALSSNFCQILVGPLRKNSGRPFFIYVGLLLLMLIGIFGFLPRTSPKVLLYVLSAVFGCGTAMVHPEGLRGAMAIKDINSATSTAMFMTVGFFGASCGPLVGALLVDCAWGLKTFVFVALFILLVILAIFAAKVNLLTDNKDKNSNSAAGQPSCVNSLPFLFLIACFMNSATTILQGLLPTFLYEMNGFSLKIGGAGALIFGFGSAVGSIIGGVLAKKTDALKITIFNLFFGFILVIAYFALSSKLAALPMLFAAGFCASSSLPLLVVMARNTKDKLVIGLKMGIMVGGSWGVAGVVLLCSSFFIEKIGLVNVMYLSGVLYALAFIFALLSMLCRKRNIIDQ